jgi:hypothetical protein
MSVMRLVGLVSIGVLLAPVELSAQRLPLPGRSGRAGPRRPAPLPPQAEPVARNLAYKRLRFSVESYPLISYVRSPGVNGAFSDWTSFGSGTRADYRLNRYASLTVDVTSSFAGGLADVYTAEVGTRIGRERWERSLYPFADLRVGYARSYRSFAGIDGGFGFPTTEDPGAFRYSSGFGGVAGLGLEYTLTRRFSLTTAASLMRNRMTARTFVGAQPDEHSYTMTLYRYTLALRYNPVRAVRLPGSDMR